MALRRCLLEMGMGIDLHGQDYTKASKRAAEDAIHRVSMLFLRALGVKNLNEVQVDVILAVPKPEAVNVAEVARVFPEGHVKITAVPGGLELKAREDAPDKVVIVNAAVFVSADVP